MPKKSDLKTVMAVVAGVIAAGYIMAQFSDVGPIGQARQGFGA